MGASERRDGNDCEDDNCECAPDGATWAVRLRYGVLRVQFRDATLEFFDGYLRHPSPFPPQSQSSTTVGSSGKLITLVSGSP
jgi:hypothetical protein